MADQTTTSGEQRPYKPSWIDRFNNWVGNLPIRAWIFYVVFGFVVVAIQLLFLWLGSGLQAEELLPVIIFNGLFALYPLPLMYLLDNQAVTALNSMRPVLDTSESEFDLYEYRLSTMPSTAPLIAGLAMVAFTILVERLWVVPIRYTALEELPVFAVVYHVVDKSSAFLFGVFIYHTIRQLRLVSSINSDRVRINLFNLVPLQAFSRLTASTSVGLVVGIYGWILINPELLGDPVFTGFAAIVTILAAAVFVWPLFGVHRLMKMEKERALRDIDLRFEAVFSEFNARFSEGDFSATEKLSGTVSSLETQHNTLKAIPTWPWKPETARLALTTIALPLLLMVLQFLAEQAFGL